MDIQLSNIKSIHQTRGGITLMIDDVGAYHFTEEQFICFHETIRYVTEKYDEHVSYNGIGYDVVRPEYLVWGEDRFYIAPAWLVEPRDELTRQLERIDHLLGFFYRDAGFVHLEAGRASPTPYDLMLGLHRTGAAGSLAIDVGFVFRRLKNTCCVIPGHVRRYISDDINETYTDIRPFEKLPAYFTYLSDLLGGVTETNSLPEVGYKLALACGLGQLELGNPTKEDLKLIQRKLMK